MLTVTQAFESMRQGLELTAAQQQAAANQQNVVRENLRQHLGGLDGDFLSGSYARRTAIRPLHDVDLFVVLKPDVHRDVYPSSVTQPSACLRKVYGALAKAYPNTSAIKLQDRSVNIVFSGTGIGYDVVPAFVNSAGVYMIPDRGRDAWIQTNPESHKTALQDANKRAGDKLNPLIKMAKHWKSTHGVPLRSFHLEVMSYGAFHVVPTRYADGVQALLAHAANAVLGSCREPAGVGPNIDAGMTQAERTKAREKLVEAEQKAREALSHERVGRDGEAHRIWKWIFGSAYPEG